VAPPEQQPETLPARENPHCARETGAKLGLTEDLIRERRKSGKTIGTLAARLTGTRRMPTGSHCAGASRRRFVAPTTAPRASRSLALGDDRSALHAQRLPVEQRVHDDATASLDEASHGASGNAHAVRCELVRKALQVNET
jgi:hypothetical protein